MNLKHWTRAVLCLSLLAVPVLAVQRPRPTPPPAPAPAPAPVPAPVDAQAQREEQAKQQRIERARQAEAERLRQEQEANRIRQARQAEAERLKQEQEAKRARRAREGAANRTEPAPIDNSGTRRAELTQTVREMFRFEDLYRDRLARVDRLIAIFRESGEAEKLREAEQLKLKLNRRYEANMKNFQQTLGPVYAQYESQLHSGQKREPGAEKPAERTPPPAPRRVPKAPIKNESTGGDR